MMYICSECGDTTLDEDLVGAVEPHGETLYHCPCGSYEITEAHECDECGEWVELAEGYDECAECVEMIASKEEAAADAKYDQMKDDRLTGDL